MDFQEMGIPLLSTLVCPETGEECSVVSNRKVLFREEEMSLTKATRITKSLPYSVQPGPHWTFGGGESFVRFMTRLTTKLMNRT